MTQIITDIPNFSINLSIYSILQLQKMVLKVPQIVEQNFRHRKSRRNTLLGQYSSYTS